MQEEQKETDARGRRKVGRGMQERREEQVGGDLHEIRKLQVAELAEAPRGVGLCG